MLYKEKVFMNKTNLLPQEPQDASNQLANLLQELLECDMINVDDVAKVARMNKDIKMYIEKIKYSATEDRYWLRLPDGKQVRKRSRDDLIKVIQEYFRNAEKTVQQRKLTFEQVYREQNAKKRTKQSTTADRNNRDFESYYIGKAPFLCKPIRDIDPKEVQEWVDAQVDVQEMTKQAHVNMTTVAKETLEYASEQGYFSGNPWPRRKKPKDMYDNAYDRKRETLQFFADNEAKAMINQCWEDFRKYPHKVRTLMIVLNFYLGLRIGELTALKWTDISSWQITIQRMEITIILRSGDKKRRIQKVVPRTKTIAGKRNIPLVKEAKKVLDCIPHRGDYIFCDPDGTRITNSIIDKVLYRMCKKVGIPQRSMHKVRKTAISNLLRAGMQPANAMVISGHNDLHTLYKHYARPNQPSSEVQCLTEEAASFLTTSWEERKERTRRKISNITIRRAV